jgi:F-type H+-transporting ATPase subunit delta
MSEYVTVARPYAKAVFEVAKNTNSFKEWENVLADLNVVLDNSVVINFVKNRTVNLENKLFFITDLIFELRSLDNNMKKNFSNFIKTLVYYNRLLSIRDIYLLYKDYVNIELDRIDVVVKIAYDLSSNQKTDIINSLSKRFNKSVSALFEFDDNLLGGFLVKNGDFVIDASVVGNLIALRNKIMG